jgi:D-3-phosphoglycerate dehydrogenase
LEERLPVSFRVVLTDQVFPSVELERDLLSSIGASLEVATGDRQEIIEAMSDADAVLTTYFPLDRGAIESLQKCQIIARYGIGVDNIDVSAARESGIKVTNVPDYCIEEVGSHALALILSLIRRLDVAQDIVKSGNWGIQDVIPIRRISTLTLGVVGVGRIGRWVIDVLQPLVKDVLIYDPYLKQAQRGTHIVELNDLLERSDIISLHCPLTDSTQGLIGSDEIHMMKPSAVLINTSRGALVQFAPLRAALEEGRIAGAALDVFEKEPPSLLERPIANLIVTPHMAFYSEEALAESQRKAATQIVKVLSGSTPDYAVS